MKTLSLCLLLLVPGFILAQTASVNNAKGTGLTHSKKSRSIESKTKNVEQVLAGMETGSGPGFAIGVIKDGNLIYSRGYGMADLEHNQKNTPASVFNIASLSKQFTGLCIMLLVEQGKLSVTDPLRKFFPDMPAYADSITVSNLLHHTSGLMDYTSLTFFAGQKLADEDAPKKMYALILRQKPLFSPGTQYSYSNTNYFLLGELVRKVSGRSLAQFSRENIFTPLGMKHTFFNDSDTLIKNRAWGYSKVNDSTHLNAYDKYFIVGAGNLYTSVEDFLLWDRNLYQNKLGKGSQSLIDSFLKVENLKNGNAGRYAAGLFTVNYKGLPYLNHNGSAPGYSSLYSRFPGQKLSLVVFGNTSELTLNVIDLLDIYLFDSAVVRKPAPKTALQSNIAYDNIRKFMGAYIINPGNILNLSLAGNSVIYKADGQSAREFIPVASNLLRHVRNEMEIELIEDSAGNLSIRQNYIQMQMRMNPLKKIIPASFDVQEINGKYWSTELQVHYTVSSDKEGIALQLNGNNMVEVKYIGKDTFYGDGVVVTLKREENKIVAFTVETGRMKNIRFVRQP